MRRVHLAKNNLFFWESSRLRALAVPILLIAILSGCGPEEKKAAQGLVKSGTKASSGLAEYYDSLGQKRSEYLALFKFDLTRTGASLAPKLENDFKEQEEALATRAQMARKLQGLYDALGKLIDYDASGEISSAAKDLKSEIEKVVGKKLAIPGLAGVDPGPILDKAIKAITEWVQLRQFRRNSPKVEVVLDSVSQLFRAEQLLYVQIAQDYDKETSAIALFLYTNHQATSLSAFQRYLDLYGLQPNASAPDDSVIRAWTVDLLNKKLAERQSSSQKEADSVFQSLVALKKRHGDFVSGKRPPTESEN